MFVKPARADLIVRHPQTMIALPPEGGELPDEYAVRRLQDGDVIEAQPVPAKAGGKTKE